MTYSNAQYWNDQSGDPSGIRVEVNGAPSFVPLDPANTDYAAIMALVAAWQLTIQDAPAPPPPPVVVTNRQLFAALALTGFIAEAEALAAGRTGAVPAMVDAVFASLPAQDAFLARLTWATMREVPRNHPLISAMVDANLATSEQVDGIFALGASLP
jgi:hypothetical protein